MCREQLVKLQPKVGELTAEGAVVLGISSDSPEAASRLVKELNLPFAILSDPRMAVIQAYGMKGEAMDMADMGYVVIDKQGRIRTRQIDRRMGENAGMILRAVRQAKKQA